MQDGDISALSSRVTELQSRVNHLREKEEHLDRLCKAMKENYKQARKDPTNEYYAYVTRDDLLDVFDNDSMILTVRNCDTIRQSTRTSEEDDEEIETHTLRLHGRWKAVDVRLVTTDGELTRRTPDGTESETSDKVQSASQSKPDELNNRRPGRRRRRKEENIQFKTDEESGAELNESNKKRPRNDNQNGEDEELKERRITAQTLLGYRPQRKELKRNLDDGSDSYDRKYL